MISGSPRSGRQLSFDTGSPIFFFRRSRRFAITLTSFPHKGKEPLKSNRRSTNLSGTNLNRFSGPRSGAKDKSLKLLSFDLMYSTELISLNLFQPIAGIVRNVETNHEDEMLQAYSISHADKELLRKHWERS